MAKPLKITEPPQVIDEVFGLISCAATGREVLGEFFPHYHLGKITIRNYPEEVAKKLRASHSKEQPSGASFVTDGRTGMIYVDFQSELGILAPFLLHEMVHSLDERLWVSARMNLGETERNKIIIESETHAFEFQYRFVQELMQIVPELDEFFSQCYPKAKILRERMTVEEIRKLYGIKAA